MPHFMIILIPYINTMYQFIKSFLDNKMSFLLFRQLFLNIFNGMANIVDPDQICICHFVRNFGVQNLRTLTIEYI